MFNDEGKVKMNNLKSVIAEAIINKKTLIAEHRYCEAIIDPLTVEVWPYKLDGDFLICYDITAGQPYAINLKYITDLKHGDGKEVSVPKTPWLK
jgi:hypothetical protein